MFSTRKAVLVFIMIMISFSLYASQLNLKAQVLVNDVNLEWSEVEGASFYDVYANDIFLARLDADTFSYTAENLAQESGYRLIVGARDENNNTLDADALEIETDSFSGVYKWVNETDDDNKGRLKEITYIARLKTSPEYGQYMEISIPYGDDELVIFPLQSLDDSTWPWIDYDDGGETALAYRLNCEKFNTSSLKPGRFRVSRIFITPESASVEIQSSAFGFKVTTTTSYDFSMREDGVYLVYETSGSGLVESALFRNPMNEDDPFTYELVRVMEI